MRKSTASRPQGRIDWAKVASFTEADIEQMAREDGWPVTTPAGKYMRVLGLPTPDVAGIRSKLKLSQMEFASTYGLTLRTIQQWEQGRAKPDHATRILLKLIETEPKMIAQLIDDIMRGRPRPKAMSALVHAAGKRQSPKARPR
jgi:putative transcriptional regulator